MHKQLIALAFTASMLWITATTPAQAAQAVATVAGLEGACSASGAGGDRALAVGAGVFLKEMVRTSAGARLELKFIDGTTINQGENAVLLIEDYLFNPDVKEDNRTLFRVFQGVLRVLTDQITKLNPEKFEVKTNYGTIGIRGCELIFKVQPDFEEVFVVGLHGVNSIVFTVNESGEKRLLTEGSKGRLEVTESGVAVSISAVDGLKQRTFTLDEIAELNALTTPAGENPSSAGSGDRDADQLGILEITDVTGGLAAAIPTPVPLADPPAASSAEEPESDEPPELAALPPVNRPSLPDRPDEPDAPDVPPPQTRTYQAAGGGGQDWSWDIWASETTTFVDGAPVVDTRYAVSSRSDALPALAFQDLADGAQLYNLSGSGDAGAVITEGSQGAVVEGSADIDVRLGMGITPVWSGDFNMNNGSGDALSFNVDGTIENGNLVKGNLNSYSLNAFGQGHGQGSLTRQDVGGNLTGSGVGPRPITGAAVDFQFDHGGGPSVRGSGGADF